MTQLSDYDEDVPESEVEKMMQDPSDDHVPARGVVSFVGEMIKITLIALAIILPVRYFLIKPFYVNGASMEPSYFNKEYLIIDEISYRFNGPERGQVAVFRYPVDPSQFFIKRVIGLPGERVVIKDGEVTIYNDAFPKGTTLQELYLSPDAYTAGSVDITLGSDELFVLGDNRSASLDSRRFGPLPVNELIGKVWLRGWPPDRVGIINEHLFDF